MVEAAYDLSVSDRDWLANLAKIVRPLLEGGHGMAAYTYDLKSKPEDLHANAQLFDMDAAILPEVRKFAAANADLTTYIHAHNEGLNALVDLGKRAGFGDLRDRPAIASFYKFAGIRDYAALQTVQPDGTGVVFCAGQAKERTYDARTRRLWLRVNAHIAAGRRLRSALGNAEAILTPSGKVEHAEGEGAEKSAQVALRDAVLRQEKARGKLRSRDPEGATQAWTAMVSGRWSLVDQFERAGRRYIVARRNEHALPDPRALTNRERAIVHLATLGRANKLIGYELGLAESTVGSHLSRAMAKLGVRSRVQLIQMIAQLGVAKTK